MRMFPPVILIAAMSRDRIIGKADGMPWQIPEEYAQFLQQVAGQTLIMGRRSFEIFGPDLTNCDLIVVSKSPPKGTHSAWMPSLETALQLARERPRLIFVGGGASIYEQTLPLADRLHLSVIHGEFQGDTYFPEFDPSDWEIEVNEVHARYEYFEYVRRMR